MRDLHIYAESTYITEDLTSQGPTLIKAKENLQLVLATAILSLYSWCESTRNRPKKANPSSITFEPVCITAPSQTGKVKPDDPEPAESPLSETVDSDFVIVSRLEAFDFRVLLYYKVYFRAPGSKTVLAVISSARDIQKATFYSSFKDREEKQQQLKQYLKDSCLKARKEDDKHVMVSAWKRRG